MPRIQVRIRVQETSDLGVIVPALEIIEPGFGIVVVSTVAERVGDSQRRCHRPRRALRLSPYIVLVRYHRRPGLVHQAHYVPLQVVYVVVQLPHELQRHSAVSMVQEHLRVVCERLAQQLPAVPQVVLSPPVYRFPDPRPFRVICIAYTRFPFL